MTAAMGAIPDPPKARRQSLRHRLADRGIDRVLFLLVPGVLFLGLLFIYPFLYGLQLSFLPASGGMFDNYSNFFADSYLRDTIWTTLTLGVPAALFNVLVSVPIAYRMRGRFRFKRTITTLLVVPIALGTVLTADGLIQLLGPSGWLNKLLRDFGLIDQPLILIHNYWGVLASLIITGFPFAFLLVLSYLSGIDPNLERAASVMGAGWWERFRRITFPLLVPGSCHHVLPVVRAGLLGLPLGQPRRRSGRLHPGDFDRRLSRRLRAVRLLDGLGDLDDHGSGNAWHHRPGSGLAEHHVPRGHGR